MFIVGVVGMVVSGSIVASSSAYIIYSCYKIFTF